MKLRHPVVLITILLAIFHIHVLYAQDGVIEEDVFWLRLEQTSLLLERASVQVGTDQTTTLDQIWVLWKSVQQVRLANETVVPVDLDWLTGNLLTDEDSLRVLQNRVDALLDYRDSLALHTGDTRQSLDTLEGVLQDQRFQYPEPESPTPLPTFEAPQDESQEDWANSTQGRSLVFPALSQMLLLGIGVVIVGALVIYLMQGLQIQPATVEEVAGEPGEDPPTAEAARDLAANSASARDYRIAIRYLYLSILLRLDEQGLIHYNPTLTNTEHLRQITNQPELLGLLHTVVTIFDDVWYGFKPVDEALYQQFREQIDQLQRMAS